MPTPPPPQTCKTGLFTENKKCNTIGNNSRRYSALSLDCASIINQDDWLQVAQNVHEELKTSKVFEVLNFRREILIINKPRYKPFSSNEIERS